MLKEIYDYLIECNYFARPKKKAAPKEKPKAPSPVALSSDDDSADELYHKKEGNTLVVITKSLPTNLSNVSQKNMVVLHIFSSVNFPGRTNWR